MLLIILVIHFIIVFSRDPATGGEFCYVSGKALAACKDIKASQHQVINYLADHRFLTPLFEILESTKRIVLKFGGDF